MNHFVRLHIHLECHKKLIRVRGREGEIVFGEIFIGLENVIWTDPTIFILGI